MLPSSMVTPQRQARSGGRSVCGSALPSTASRIPRNTGGGPAAAPVGSMLAPPSTLKRSRSSRAAGSNVMSAQVGRRRSSSMGAAGGPRASSIYGLCAPGFKDSRPISDRAYQRDMAAKLMKYLGDNKAYGHLSERQLMSMTKQEFGNVFSFIFSRLVPDYRIHDRLEDHIPPLFRSLGYPVLIKPSTLQTVSAPSSTPHVLAALTYLIDLIEILDGTDMDTVFYQQTSTDDLKPGMDENMAKENVFRSPEEQRAELQRKRKELEKLRSATTVDQRLAELKEKLAAQQREKIDVNAYVKRVQSINSDSERVVANALSAFESKKHEIADAQAELERKRRQIAAQPMSGDEARSLRQHADSARKRLSARQAELTETQQQKFALEKEISRLAAEIESRWNTFRKDARALLFKMDKEAASRYEEAIDWDVSPHSPTFADYLSSTVLPGVAHLCDEQRRRAAAYRRDSLLEAERMDALKANIAAVDEQIAECVEQMNEAKKRRKDAKHELEVALREDKTRVQELERRLEQLRLTAARDAGLGAEADEVQRLKAQYAAEAERLEADLIGKGNALVRLIDERVKASEKHKEVLDDVMVKLRRFVEIKRKAEADLAASLKLSK